MGARGGIGPGRNKARWILQKRRPDRGNVSRARGIHKAYAVQRSYAVQRAFGKRAVLQD